MTRIVLRLKSGIHWSAKPGLHSSIRWQAIWGVFVCSRRSPENCNRGSDIDRTEERDRQLLRHPLTSRKRHEFGQGRGINFTPRGTFLATSALGKTGLPIAATILP